MNYSGGSADDKIGLQSREESGAWTMRQKVELTVLNNSPTPHAGMNRRQMVKRLAEMVGAGLAVPGVAAAHPIHKHLTSELTLAAAEEKAALADWSQTFLDTHQHETL